MQEIRGISSLDFELLVADITERVVTNFEKHLEKKTEEIVDLATENAVQSATDDVERLVQNALDNGQAGNPLEITTSDLNRILTRALESPCHDLNHLKRRICAVVAEGEKI